MKNISDNTSLDSVSFMHAKIMNGAELNSTDLFGPAVVLDGDDDWIDIGLYNKTLVITTAFCTSYVFPIPYCHRRQFTFKSGRDGHRS